MFVKQMKERTRMNLTRALSRGLDMEDAVVFSLLFAKKRSSFLLSGVKARMKMVMTWLV